VGSVIHALPARCYSEDTVACNERISYSNAAEIYDGVQLF
jgi:hypothetical protein